MNNHPLITLDIFLLFIVFLPKVLPGLCLCLNLHTLHGGVNVLSLQDLLDFSHHNILECVRIRTIIYIRNLFCNGGNLLIYLLVAEERNFFIIYIALLRR